MDPSILSLLSGAKVMVPAYELIVLVLALAFCLLFRFSRTGLITAYLFTVHMGWLFCEKELTSPALMPYAGTYFIFAGLVFFLAIISTVVSSD